MRVLIAEDDERIAEPLKLTLARAGFVVETETEKLLCEPKRADQMKDPVVLAKAHAAATWCSHATVHETENQGKPWRYVLIPHDAIADNMTVAGLVKSYVRTEDAQ